MKHTGVFTALAWVFGALGAITLLGADAWAAAPNDVTPANPLHDYRDFDTTTDLKEDENASITNGVLTIGDLSATSGAFGGWDPDGTTTRPGGGFLYVSSASTNRITGLEIDQITLTGTTVAPVTNTLYFDGSENPLSNAYGPIMILGGEAVWGTNPQTIKGFTLQYIDTKYTVTAGNSRGVSAWGGGAYISALSNLTIGASSFDNITLTMELGDTGTSDTTGYHAGGGALAIYLPTGGTVTIGDSTNTTLTTFTNNKVVVKSAVDETTGEDLFTATTTPGFVQGHGGALKLVGDVDTGTTSDFTLYNVKFEDNGVEVSVSDGQALGGAIFAQNADLAITGSTFTDNSATGDTAQGGAIWIADDATTPAITLTLTNVNFSTNSSSGTTAAQGGAIYATGIASTGTGSNIIPGFTITGSAFDGNYATGTTAQGGAIWTDSNLAISDTTFTNNYATSTTTPAAAYGGAIYASGEGKLTLTGVTFSGNYTFDSATDSDGNLLPTSRNAIYLADGASVTFADYKDDDGNVIAKATSYDYDGIAGSGTVTMESTGKLYLYGDYSGLTGIIALEAGTTYFNNDTVTNVSEFTLGSTGATATSDATIIMNVSDNNSYSSNSAATNTAVIQAQSATVGDNANILLRGYKAGQSYALIRASNTTGYDSKFTTGDNYEFILGGYTIKSGENNTLYADDVYRNTVASVAHTSNQSALGSYLDRDNWVSGLEVGNYIEFLTPGEEDLFYRALNTSTGDIYASGMAAIAQWDRRGNDMLIDRMNTVFMSDSPLCSAPYVDSGSAYGSSGYTSANVSGIWAQVEGYHYKSDSTANAGQAKSKGWGLALGYDKLIADWVFGIAFRYGDSRLDVHERNARVDTDSYSLSLYGGKRVCVGPGVLHVIGGMTGGYHDNDSRRTQQLGASSYSYTADYDSKTLSAYLDTGVTFGDTNRFAFQPFVNVMWSGIWNDSVTEKGSSDRLHVGSDDHDWWSTSLGGRAMGRVHNNLAFDVNAAWRHTYGTLSASTQNRFVSASTGDRFTVRGTPLERNEGVVGAGLTCNITENVFVRASYDYIFGSGKAQSHEGFLNIGVAF